MKELNLIGRKFNKLTAKEKIKISGRCHYICDCDCGNTKTVEGWKLSSGYTKSCGCLNREADSYRNESKRLYAGLSNARRVISYYARNAKNRGIEFKLTESQCIAILTEPCYYCGRIPFSKLEYKGSWGVFIFSGIDRIVNDGHYTIENVVPCCKDCNHMKKDLSKNEFLNIINLIYKNLNT